MSPVRASAWALVVAVVAGVSPAGAEDDPNAVTVTAKVLNPSAGPEGPAKPRFEVSGRVPYLPDGTILHVSLQVRDRSPVIQAAFFQVETRDKGSFSGYQEWEGVTFAPLGYRTVVTLAMQAQNPAVRRYLGRELGYVSDTNATIGTVDEDLGTPDERATFAVECLRALSRFTERAIELQRTLDGKTAAPADGTWQSFVTGFNQQLKQLSVDIDTLKARHIVWYEAHTFGLLEQCVRIESRAARKHGQGKPDGRQDVVTVGADLSKLQADIDARLPSEPGDTPRHPAPAPATEATPPAPTPGGRPLPPGVPPPAGTPRPLPPGVPPPAGTPKPGGR